MAYVTQQGLVDRGWSEELIQLTDRTNMPPSTIDPVPVARAIADAGALIDGYVGKRYALPIAGATPPLLERLAADIARYLLHSSAASEAIRDAYDDAMKILRDIANGLVQLDVAGVVVPAAGAGGVQMSADPRVFTRNSLRGL